MKRMFRKCCIATALSFNALSSHSADLIDAATTDGSFKTLVGAIKTAGLSDMLKVPGPYTFFAPTDEALSKLSEADWATLRADRVQLAKLISMHLVPGKIMIADVKPGKFQTVHGNAVKLSSDNGKVVVNNANVIQSDVQAENGIIHAMDQVIAIPE